MNSKYMITLDNKERYLKYIILNLFAKNTKLTLSEIDKLLKSKKLEYSREDILKVLNYLLVTEGQIVVDNYLKKEDLYTWLDRYYWQSAYSEYYRNLYLDTLVKKVLLISDTHIGSEIENLELINKVYQYGEKQGVEVVFHMGDLFSRLAGNNLEKEKKFNKCLDSFIKYYPPNLKTYGVLGNHDLMLQTLYQRREWVSFDLRGLTYYKNNFYLFPHDSITSTLSNKSIHFTHRFYLNQLQSDFKMHELKDIENNVFDFRSNYDITICGHLHNAFMYTDIAKGKNIVYIGVPSTSNININQTCALMLEFLYQDGLLGSFYLTPLKFINNSLVKEERLEYNFEQPKKLIRRLI